MSCNCKPYLAAANAAVADTPTEGNIPLGALVGKECCKYRLAGDGIVIRGCGQNLVHGTVVMKPATTQSTAVELSCELRRNGQPVQGAKARIDSTAVVTLPIVATVSGDACSTTTLTLVNTGADASILSTSIVLEPV